MAWRCSRSLVAAWVLLSSVSAPAETELSGQGTRDGVNGATTGAAGRDLRDIRHGRRIPDEGYCDQPYVVINQRGEWVCLLTTGPEHEGASGQHYVSTVSSDHGKTWTPLVDLEPSDGPEASYGVPLITPYGRIYAFYTYNGDRVSTLPGDSKRIRADTLGWYCYRYSSDGGHTWSKNRYRLPMRVTACDRNNNWRGKVQIFWGIDKPEIHDGVATFAFTKLGRYMLKEGEGWLYRSDNILTERDVEKLRWDLLPPGEHGIRSPEFGSVQEEHNHVPLGDGRLYMVYRTTTGYPCHCYSDDGGQTWTKPEHMTYTPGGRRIENPRACPKLWRCRNGKYLFWFHNHNGLTYKGRNPVWISGGELRDGNMYWSQPEILLYAEDPSTRMSYPDLIEQDGRYWVTETQKTVARVHEVDPTLLQGLWNQGENQNVAQDELVLETGSGKARLSENLDLRHRGGLTLDVWLQLATKEPGQVLADARTPDGRGFALVTAEGGSVRLKLSDGETKATWDCDQGLIKSDALHHVVAIVDARPRIISFVVDGQLCDGGEHREYGWGRYQDPLGDLTGGGTVNVGSPVQRLRLYGRYLRTSEAVANYHAGPHRDSGL
ncbi:MAG: sialidase family protein [Planctomycetota bacterium]